MTAEDEVEVRYVDDEHRLMLRNPRTGEARYPLSTRNGIYRDQLEQLAAAICGAQEAWT